MPDVVRLQSVSKHFLRICRDNPHWRARCLENSAVREDVLLHRRGSDWVDEDGVPLIRAVPTTEHPLQPPGVIESIGYLGSRKREREYSRIVANWDPTFPGEKTNWYHEYIQRHAPITTNWFERPCVVEDDAVQSRTMASQLEDIIDVRGVALYKPSQFENQLFAVSPLEDGSICLWDIKGTNRRKGSILSRSRAKLLWDAQGISPVDISRRSIDRGIVECVSVDSQRHTAFFAVGNSKSLISLFARRTGCLPSSKTL